MTSTSARPGTLVESSGYAKGNDALKWKDKDADTIDDKEFEDRIRSLELRLDLHKLHVPQPMKRLIKFGNAGAKANKNVNQNYPMES